MSDATVDLPAPQKRRSWFKTLAFVFGGVIVLLVAAYFVGTSSAFFKGVILPKVSKQIGADVTVTEASISPFSQVVLRDLKVQAKGAEPLLTAPEVRVRYSLMDIIGGKITVAELALVSPTVSLVESADGTRNLDALKQAAKGQAKPPAPSPAKPSKPLAVDVKNVDLKNATVRQLKNLKGGGRELIELSSVNVALSDLKNGQAGKLNLSADIKVDSNLPASGTNGSLQAKLNGNFTFDLSQDLFPKSVKGNAALVVEKATGTLADLAACAVGLDCEATPTEIRQAMLKFVWQGQALGAMTMTGPFDAQKREGKLKITVTGIGNEVLNLAGARYGILFGSTKLAANYDIELKNQAQQVTTVGTITASQFSLEHGNLSTPAVDFQLGYDIAVDLAKTNAVIRSFNLNATQSGRPLLKAGITKPMLLEWGRETTSFADSALEMSLTDLNLADWRAVLGTNVVAGTLNGKLNLNVQQAGKSIAFDLASRLAGLAVQLDATRLEQIEVITASHGQLLDFRHLQLADFETALAHAGQAVATLKGSGQVDSQTLDADVRLDATASLPQLANLVAKPDVSFSSGEVTFSGRFAQTNLTPIQVKNPKMEQSLRGNVRVAELGGQVGASRFAGFEAAADLALDVKDQLAIIRQLAAELKQAGQPAGRFDAKGSYHLVNQAGDLSLRLTDLNQNALRPFLAPALGDKSLSSVAINANLDGRYDAKGDAALKGDVQVANLVVNDPKGQIPSTPLEAKFKLDLGARKQTAEIRECVLSLTPTPHAKNELTLRGQLDFSKTNAIQGGLRLTAESLDVTRYYDLFAGKSAKGAPTASAETPQSSPAPRSEKEPDAVKLPLRNFTMDANIGRTYLREVDIANLQASAKISGGHAVLKPLQLTLNGAPINGSADLDLGVPGFNYDVALSANKVPLAPLVNSFVPERKGQIGGTTTATAELKGAGVTGASLQKNLVGQFDFVSTNLNLSLANVKSRVLKSVINVVAGIPDMVRNPSAALGNVLSRLTGAPGGRSGWADKLTASPIDVITMRGNAGSGRIEIPEATVRSASFLAEASGGITLAPILTNSAMQFPVTISLSRSLADEVGLVPAGTPTNAPYAKLPDFFAMRGTLGKPDPKIDKLALAAVALKTGGGVLGRTGNASVDKVGGTLGVLGNLLGGPNTPQSSPTATNVPAATNRPQSDPVNNLLRGFGGLLGGSATTRTNGADATATNQPPPTNPLDLFRRKP